MFALGFVSMHAFNTHHWLHSFLILYVAVLFCLQLEVEKMPKKEFFFFATLMEATMINEEFKDKEISFEFSIG